MSEGYKSVALLMRFVYCAIGIAIVAVSAYMLRRDSRRAALIRKDETEAGRLAALIINGETFGVVREGTVGSGKTCDIVIRNHGLKKLHFYFELDNGELNLFPLQGTVGLAGAKETDEKLVVRNKEEFSAGGCMFQFRMTKPFADSASPANARARGDD